MKKFKLSIRNTVIIFNALLITVTVGAVIFVYTSGSDKSIYSLADNLMLEITKSSVNKTATYLQPAERAIQDLGRHYFEQGFRGFRDDQKLQLEYLKTILSANPEFRAVYFADSKGNLIMQRRMPDGSLTERFIERKPDGVHVTWVHSNPNYYADYPNEIDGLDKGYNPVDRPWFTIAQMHKALVWTPVYVFATDRMPGLSCVLPVYDTNGALYGVCAIDIGILDLSYFLKNLSTTPHAKTFLLDSHRRVLGLPLSPQDPVDSLFQKTKTGEMDLRTVADLHQPLYDEAYTRFTTLGQPQAPFSFINAGSRYFSMFSSVPSQSGLDLTFGIILPDDDLTGAVKMNNWIAIGISLLMLVLAVFLSVVLSAAIANPIRLLIEEMDKVKDFVLESESHVHSMILEIGTMSDSFATMKQGLKNFRKYVPADLVHQLIRMEKDATLGGERRELTIFFSDIANFTSISEHLPAEEMVADLCEYFAIVSKTIEDHKGTLDKYIGDSVMAFWGAPEPVENHVAEACHTALRIKNDLQILFHVWENKGKPRLHTRVGLHVGEVIAGNMGYEKRMNYTILGDGVNLASRMEGLNKFYGTEILVTGAIHKQARDEFEFRKVDKVAVKGKTEVIDVYELLAERDQISPGHKKVYELYEIGLEHYFRRDWSLAGKHFLQVLKFKPQDGPSLTLVERCKRFLASPPPDSWDGVNRLEEK